MKKSSDKPKNTNRKVGLSKSLAAPYGVSSVGSSKNIDEFYNQIPDSRKIVLIEDPVEYLIKKQQG